MARRASFGAALISAWLTQGTIGFADSAGPRLAVLPLSIHACVVSGLAGLAVLALARLGASLAPLALFGLVVLPWLPITVPPALLIWVFPASLVIWVAVLALMIASIPAKPRLPPFPARRTAFAAALVVFSLSAWRASPMVPGGDEPHYLVITQSILLDGDLTIEDVHRRRDYRAYFDGDLPPHVQRRGRDGAIYSVHAPGLPVLVAPAFAVAGYRGVVVFLLVLSSVGSVLAWHVAWLATRRADAAWFAWAAVALPVTAIFQSFTIYPDGAGGVLALTGLWALVRAGEEASTRSERAVPWFWHGVALALLPWLHSRFAVLAGGFGALILLRLARTPNPAAKAVAFLAVPAISAILWVGFFVAIYGTPDPSAPYAAGELGSMAFVPGGLTGLLFDQRFGLLVYAPVLVFAFVGLGLMIARSDSRRLGLELVFVIVPYLLTVTHFAMWWGGWSAPARFFAPVLPLFAVPAAVAWTVMQGRGSRFLARASLVLTAVASVLVVTVDRGRLAFNTREAPALWLEWLGRLSDLTAAAPMWARDTDLPLFRAAAIWVAVGIGIWIALRSTERSPRFRNRAALHTFAAALLALGVMLASTLVWAVERSSGRRIVASQLHLLNAVASEERLLAAQLNPFSSLYGANVAGRLRIEQAWGPVRRPGGRDSLPLLALPSLPAGQYRIRVNAVATGGWLMVGIARDSRDPFALRTIQLPVDTIDLDFPLPVRALVIRGDEDARRAVRALSMEPLTIARPGQRLTSQRARRAVRYDGTTVYFLDDRSYPEPEAFWVAGARESTVVIQPDAAEPTRTILVRNAPVDNRVTLSSAGWREVLDLRPGEERAVGLPIQTTRGGALVTIETRAGFRPAEHDPASRDHRFLGVWVKVDP